MFWIASSWWVVRPTTSRNDGICISLFRYESLAMTVYVSAYSDTNPSQVHRVVFGLSNLQLCAESQFANKLYQIRHKIRGLFIDIMLHIVFNNINGCYW